SQNNLRLITIALHHYAGKHGKLPPAAVIDNNGKPILSWRVLILPHLGQEALYKQFKLNEPWDSTDNAKLVGQMPALYAHPMTRGNPKVQSTYYQAFVGPGTVFQVKQSLSLERITEADGVSNT